ncbi:uncharacterized protein B0T23DRAFT_315600, partial [Neurospora hispaniola]
LEYDPQFGVLANTAKYLNYYIINSIPSKIINLEIDSIYVVLPSFITNLIE